MNITELKPQIVWKFFHQITQVPRPSKKEGKIIEYLKSFAQEYNIPIKVDEAGNILMSKPATPGKENLPASSRYVHLNLLNNCNFVKENQHLHKQQEAR